MDDGQSPKKKKTLLQIITHHRQNPSDFMLGSAPTHSFKINFCLYNDNEISWRQEKATAEKLCVSKRGILEAMASVRHNTDMI
jgi:hypothetical protein